MVGSLFRFVIFLQQTVKLLLLGCRKLQNLLGNRTIFSYPIIELRSKGNFFQFIGQGTPQKFDIKILGIEIETTIVVRSIQPFAWVFKPEQAMAKARIEVLSWANGNQTYLGSTIRKLTVALNSF